MKEILIETPIKDNVVKDIQPGALVKITGYIYTIRDASLSKLKEDVTKKKKFPFPTAKSVIYFCGPSPTQKGKIIGACGPTTTARMEAYFEMLLKAGIKGFIGKGPISNEAINLLKRNNAIYFVATGGAGAFLSTFVKSKEVIAYKDLGAQAVHKIDVKNFPVITASIRGTTVFK